MMTDQPKAGDGDRSAHGLDAWKRTLEEDFRRWLGELSAPVNVPTTAEEPDLYSFYEELCVLRNEMRTGNRKTSEVLSRFAEDLTGFSETLLVLQDSLGDEATGPDRELLVSLVDLRARLGRLELALDGAPEKRLWGNYERWQRRWQRFREGFDILLSHTDALLGRQGVRRIETCGKPFDPNTMIAVAGDETTEAVPGTVTEEIKAGYKLKGLVLQFAEVKVAKPEEKT